MTYLRAQTLDHDASKLSPKVKAAIASYINVDQDNLFDVAPMVKIKFTDSTYIIFCENE